LTICLSKEIEINDILLLSLYSCPNCNSSGNLTIQRHVAGNKTSILLWNCKGCNHSWKQNWYSYSESVWPLPYQDDSKQPQQQQQQLQIVSEVL
jgi:ribosomal protein L37AE/L43A